jgi:phytoene/squalene synthetase
VSAEACAALVERGDPERFRTVLAAPPERGPGLMALYAFNLEVARAPWVSAEPMIVQIRLRWWLEAVEEIVAGAPPRRHEVVGPLAETIRGTRAAGGGLRAADRGAAPMPTRRRSRTGRRSRPMWRRPMAG